MSKTYNLPSGQSWIKKLNASEAAAQIEALGMVPADTLEENRVILGKIVRQKGRSEGETPKESDQEGMDCGVVTGAEGGETRDALASYPRHQDGQMIGPGDPPLGFPDKPTESKGGPSNTEQGVTGFSDQLLAIMDKMHEHTIESIITAKNQPSGNNGGGKLVFEMIGQMGKFIYQGPQTILNFLYKVGDLVSLNLLGERDILVAILVKTDGALRAIWSEAIAQGLGWDDLKVRVIEEFFPPREKRELIRDTVYRLQRPNELMREFVQDIKRAAAILTPELSEKEVVTLVMQQVNPRTRGHFVMQTFPVTFRDLDQLGKVSAEFSSLDEEYKNRFGDSVVGGVNFSQQRQNNFRPNEGRGGYIRQPIRENFGPRAFQNYSFRGGNGPMRPFPSQPPRQSNRDERESRPWGGQPAGNGQGRRS